MFSDGGYPYILYTVTIHMYLTRTHCYYYNYYYLLLLLVLNADGLNYDMPSLLLQINEFIIDELY